MCVRVCVWGGLGLGLGADRKDSPVLVMLQSVLLKGTSVSTRPRREL